MFSLLDRFKKNKIPKIVFPDFRVFHFPKILIFKIFEKEKGRFLKMEIPFVVAKFTGNLGGDWVNLPDDPDSLKHLILIAYSSKSKNDVLFLWDPHQKMQNAISGCRDRVSALKKLDTYLKGVEPFIFCKSVSGLAVTFYCNNANGKEAIEVATEGNKFIKLSKMNQEFLLDETLNIMPTLKSFYESKMATFRGKIGVDKDTVARILQTHFSKIPDAAIGMTRKNGKKMGVNKEVASERSKRERSLKTEKNNGGEGKRSEKKRVKTLNESLMISAEKDSNGAIVRQQPSVAYSDQDKAFLEKHGHKIAEEQVAHVRCDDVVPATVATVGTKATGNLRKIFQVPAMYDAFKRLGRNHLVRCAELLAFQPGKHENDCELYQSNNNTFFYVPSYDLVTSIMRDIWSQRDAVLLIFGYKTDDDGTEVKISDVMTKEDFFKSLTDYFHMGDISSYKEAIFKVFEDSFYLETLFRNKKYEELLKKGLKWCDILTRIGNIRFLIQHGQSFKDLLMKCPFDLLIKCGANSEDFRKERVSVEELINGGISTDTLHEIGFSFEEIQGTGANVDQLVQQSFFGDDDVGPSDMDMGADEFFTLPRAEEERSSKVF